MGKSETNADDLPLLIAVLGPTASGKTALGLQLCVLLGGEVVNCDSMQMVRGMDVGTAKPTVEERRLVPHHLFDIIDPDEVFSAGRYASLARETCRAIADRNKVPVVVGGTGLYLKSLLEGIFEGPGRDPDLRKRLHRVGRKRGWDFLYRWLERVDPEAAGKLYADDHVRIVRALEVYLQTGRKISRLQPERKPLQGFQVVKLGLNPDRESLYSKIDRRVKEMFESGLLQEVDQLLKEGFAASAKGFEALGYRHAVAVLQEDISLEEAISLTQRETRRYAKRQLTWFRKEPNVHWMENFGGQPETQERARNIVFMARQKERS